MARLKALPFSHGASQVATYCGYFDMCLCLQLYSAPHFAFKYMVQLLLQLMIEPGASVCPASVALCSCHRLAIKPTELHQLPAAFGIERSTGGWGAWWSSLELGHGFNCYWKMLPSTQFNLWFYKCAVPNCMTCHWGCHKKVPVKSLNSKQKRRGPWTCCKQLLLVT